MRDVIDDVTRWQAAGESDIALATVVATWGSAPRRVGAKMAFTAGGQAISGSVSGGCVEGAVIEAGGEVLAGGPPRLLHFGVADETAWGVGLACGGTIEVFVERLDRAASDAARRWLDAEARGTLLTVIAGPDGRLGGKAIVAGDAPPAGPAAAWLDEATLARATAARRPERLAAAGLEWFIDPIRPAPSLILIGGAHIAVALARLARAAGYRVVVIDPRRAFVSAARFPDADRLIHDWPGRALAKNSPGAESAVITLSHDPKIDDPALRLALDSEAFYIGALGSRKTHAARRERLAALGYSEAQLARIHAPVGLDIGAETPEEIAVAVLAEVISVQYSVSSRSVGQLS